MALGKYYFIASRFNGLVLDIEGQSDDPGTPVIMWGKKDDEPDNQLWYDDHDTDTIRSKQNDLCLTVQDGQLCVDEYRRFNNDDQKWIFHRARGIIRNGEDRDIVLDIEGCSEEEGAKVIGWEENGQDNQQWDCQRVFCRYFMIKGKMNGLVLDIKGASEDEGAKVIMWEESGDDNQLWWEDENNVIRSKLTGFALQGKDDDEGECIRCYEYDEGNEDQAWIRAGRDLIINRFDRQKALDIKGADDDEGTKVIIWERHGEENQQFEFTYV